MKQPRTSGFCNPTLPRTEQYDPHQKCHGCDCRAPGCPCNPATQEVPVPEPDPTLPTEAVDMVAEIAEVLDRALKGYAPEDWTDAVRLLHSLRRATNRLALLDASLVQWIYLHGEHGIHLHIDGIPGDTAITRGRAKERWEGEAAVRDYVGARIRDLGGEFPDPEQVIEWVLEVVPAAKCRVTPLRTVGLDVEDYRTSEPGNLQVGLPKDQP